jgi:hypothetical protein
MTELARVDEEADFGACIKERKPDCFDVLRDVEII